MKSGSARLFPHEQPSMQTGKPLSAEGLAQPSRCVACLPDAEPGTAMLQSTGCLFTSPWSMPRAKQTREAWWVMRACPVPSARAGRLSGAHAKGGAGARRTRRV